MTAQKAVLKAELPDVVDDAGEFANQVRLRGRLAAAPRLRKLPSGDTVWNLRVVVERPPVPVGKDRPRQRVDSLECAVWSGRLKKQGEKGEPGHVVDVTGSLRRRFFRAGGATASRVEVELTGGRLIRRAGSG